MEVNTKYHISLKIVRLIDKSAEFKFQQTFMKDRNVQISKIE